MRPLSSWDDATAEFHADLVWHSHLDERWLIEVQRTGDYTGVLCVFDHSQGDALLSSEPVGLAYGARFGPDVEDVMEWQARPIAIVDAQAAQASAGHAGTGDPTTTDATLDQGDQHVQHDAKEGGLVS